MGDSGDTARLPLVTHRYQVVSMYIPSSNVHGAERLLTGDNAEIGITDFPLKRKEDGTIGIGDRRPKDDCRAHRNKHSVGVTINSTSSGELSQPMKRNPVTSNMTTRPAAENQRIAFMPSAFNMSATCCTCELRRRKSFSILV